MKKLFWKLLEWVAKITFCGITVSLGLVATYSFSNALIVILEGILSHINQTPDAWSLTEVNISLTCLIATFFLLGKSWSCIFRECNKCIRDDWNYEG